MADSDTSAWFDGVRGEMTAATRRCRASGRSRAGSTGAAAPRSCATTTRGGRRLDPRLRGERRAPRLPPRRRLVRRPRDRRRRARPRHHIASPRTAARSPSTWTACSCKRQHRRGGGPGAAMARHAQRQLPDGVHPGSRRRGRYVQHRAHGRRHQELTTKRVLAVDPSRHRAARGRFRTARGPSSAMGGSRGSCADRRRL